MSQNNPSEVELYRCPKCGHIDDADNFDVLGADGDQQFCNCCHHEHVLVPFHPSRKGGEPAEWPDDLRVREYPRAPGGDREGEPLTRQERIRVQERRSRLASQG